MNKMWCCVLGLMVGFGGGMYANSKLYHNKFFNKIKDQIKYNADSLEEKTCDDKSYEEDLPKSKLNESLELRIIELDRDNNRVILMGDDGKEYKLDYDEVLLKGIISEKSLEKYNE